MASTNTGGGGTGRKPQRSAPMKGVGPRGASPSSRGNVYYEDGSVGTRRSVRRKKK